MWGGLNNFACNCRRLVVLMVWCAIKSEGFLFDDDDCAVHQMVLFLTSCDVTMNMAEGTEHGTKACEKCYLISKQCFKLSWLEGKLPTRSPCIKSSTTSFLYLTRPSSWWPNTPATPIALKHCRPSYAGGTTSTGSHSPLWPSESGIDLKLVWRRRGLSPNWASWGRPCCIVPPPHVLL